jgi:hypothetical protein
MARNRRIPHKPMEWMNEWSTICWTILIYSGTRYSDWHFCDFPQSIQDEPVALLFLSKMTWKLSSTVKFSLMLLDRFPSAAYILMYRCQCHVSKRSCLSTARYFDNHSTEMQCLKLMTLLIDISAVFSDCCRFSGDLPLLVSDLWLYFWSTNFLNSSNCP